jgi:hypothetical protein
MSHSTLSDAELIQQLGEGNNTALAELFDRHATAVSRYAWSLATSRSDAEEIPPDRDQRLRTALAARHEPQPRPQPRAEAVAGTQLGPR